MDKTKKEKPLFERKHSKASYEKIDISPILSKVVSKNYDLLKELGKN